MYHSEFIVLPFSNTTVASWQVMPKKQARICFFRLVSCNWSWNTYTVDGVLFRSHIHDGSSVEMIQEHLHRIFLIFIWTKRHKFSVETMFQGQIVMPMPQTCLTVCDMTISAHLSIDVFWLTTHYEAKVDHDWICSLDCLG